MFVNRGLNDPSIHTSLEIHVSETETAQGTNSYLPKESAPREEVKRGVHCARGSRLIRANLLRFLKASNILTGKSVFFLMASTSNRGKLILNITNLLEKILQISLLVRAVEMGPQN